jgi:sialic acid synthase SpsE/mannose-6-phosphate isomerase-like protein (cupin superfamily)
MKTPFKFEDLFIYDLANNHQGSFQHALKIVDAVAQVNRQGKVRGALKFQFRQLDTFIHPDYRTRADIKYVKRFSETRLEMSDFEKLARSVASHGLSTMCTPFDEESVDVLCDMGIEIIKVASCSADDWPLLEKIARVNKPIVASLAGLRTEEIDALVNFFQGARVEFALMHCVALYPTPDDKLQINQISFLKERYQEIPIGWSTHEDPQNTAAVQLAYAKGARLFERHVGLADGEYKLNSYSSTPAQLEKWIAAYWEARAMLGAGERPPSPLEERNTLNELKRGVYVRRDVPKGKAINQEDIFFAMPVQEGQLLSGQWRLGIVANMDYPAHAPLRSDAIQSTTTDDHLVYQIMLQIRGMLNKARIRINEDAAIEISHHFGLRRFREYGAVIVTCINRSYAKKLVIQLPRQKHPYHYHQKKEETFQLLDGDLEIFVNGNRINLTPGETLLVEPTQWHKFHTLDGCIFEEVSTTHFNNDSFYEDPEIAKLSRDQRKTKVDNWFEYFRAKHVH